MALTRKQWGLIGLGVVLVGGVILYRRRKSGGLGRVRFIGQRFAEAPAIDGYSDGNMRTTMRASEAMPIEERLASIQQLVHKSVQDPEMRKLALSITAQCPERDGECEARAVYAFVKDNVRYTGDVAPIKFPNGEVEGIDLYQSARRTLEFGGGDCDDQSVLIATLLALNGITPRLRVMKEGKSDDWSHIFPLAGLPKMSPSEWVALDTTLPGRNKFGTQ
ncbi:MAG: transglutaminase-like domain-containing protein, partial [Tepidisphaeraceae bacterium]